MIPAVGWLLAALLAWAGLGTGAAIFIGRCIAVAQHRERRSVVGDGYATGRADLQLTHKQVEQ